MFALDSQRLITWLLILSIGHVPLPWVHSHAIAGAEQLAAHVQQFHVATPDGIPQGWHLHVVCLGLAQHRLPQGGLSALDDQAHSHRLHGDQLPPMEEGKDWSPSHERKQRVRTSSNPGLVALGDVAKVHSNHLRNSHNARNLSSRAPLYELHSSLLL